MRRDLILVAISLIIWGVGENMFIFFTPLYLQELGASPVVIGSILGTVGLAMTVAHLPAGYLADRIGRKPLLVAAWIIGILATGVMALAPSMSIFVAGYALYGMTSFVVSPLNSYVTTARGNWSVGRAITLVSAAYNIGAFAGPLLGGWTGERLGLRTNYFIAAAFFIASTAAIVFIRPQALDQPDPQAKRDHFRPLLAPRFLGFAALTFLVMFSLYLPQPLSQNFLQNERGLSLAQIGVLISARSLGVILLNLGLGQLNAFLGFLLAQVAMAGFALLLWKGQSFAWYFVGYLLVGSYMTARGLTTAQGWALVKASSMGLAYGMLETVMGMVIIAAPPLAGLLYERSPSLVYSTALALIGISLVVTLLFSPVRPGRQ
jgi:MFS family permease